MSRVAIALGVVLVLGACAGDGGAPPTTESLEAIEARIQAGAERLQRTPEPMRGSIQSWYNATGLPQLSPAVWQARLDRACGDGFWQDPSVLERLGDEFVAADIPLIHPFNDPDAIVMEDVYVSLWTMALNHCRGLVPPDVVEDGPPHMNRGG